METILGHKITVSTNAVVYICELANDGCLNVKEEVIFSSSYLGVCYAHIMRQSIKDLVQIAHYKGNMTMEEELQKLHNNLFDPTYLSRLDLKND